MSARRLGLSPVAGARSRHRAVKLALGIDAAEFDRAVAHRPGALFGFLQPDRLADQHLAEEHQLAVPLDLAVGAYPADLVAVGILGRSEEHTSELQSLMRISYAVFCLKKTKHTVKLP